MPRVTREQLTLNKVKNAKPDAQLYRLRDSAVPGLLLRVAPTGRKAWAITWARGQERVIGTYPVMTLEGAREVARRELGEAAAHGAPMAVIEARKPASEMPITLGDFVRDHFANWACAHQKAGKATLDALEAVFGGLYERDLRSVSAFDIERIKAHRLKAGKMPATVNRDLDRIRKVFSCAVEWSFLSEHPLKAVKRAKGADDGRVRYLAPGEEKRLRDALLAREATRRKSRLNNNEWCIRRNYGEGRPLWPENGFTDHLMPLVLVALNTGMRRGELFGLRWEHVNLVDGLATVTAGNAKSRKGRHIPLNDEARDTLTRWANQGTGFGLVFPGIGGGRLTNVNRSWDGVVTKANLSEFRFHDLRHDFASKLVMAGVDLNTVRELLGHADIKMTLRYAHLAPGKLADAVAAIGRGRAR